MDKFLDIIKLILVSSVKFVAGPAFAYFEKDTNFSFLLTNLCCILGGMLGVWFFTFFSLEIQIAIGWVRRKISVAYMKSRLIIRSGHEEDLVHPHMITQKVFSKRSRKFVRLWRKYGMAGVAFLTPVIISIPVGTIILNLFEDHKGKIFLYMFLSIIFWSLVLTSLFELFHIVVNLPDLKDKVIG